MAYGKGLSLTCSASGFDRALVGILTSTGVSTVSYNGAYVYRRLASVLLDALFLRSIS